MGGFCSCFQVPDEQDDAASTSNNCFCPGCLLHKFKNNMNMIVNECVRLYPPALTITRRVGKETRIGELCFPPGMNIYISVLALHHDPQIWGQDVHLFKPERFAKGVAKATNNKGAAFVPFGMGTRTSVGLNFTANEAKIAVSMILQKYKFILSPNYVHCPVEHIHLIPKNGIQVILQKM